ncbi:MAG: hypothetical protein JWR77_680, partial [Rhizorhabdus sp.]|nr:hypothetical protein [Rhizorhabdus sp.]
MATAASNIPAHVPAELVLDCPVADRQVYVENV